jgi:hypothetical protein
MTAASAPVLTGPVRAPRRPLLAGGRLLWLELRHNVMLWLLPVTLAVFWFVTYRTRMTTPPLWYLRATDLQTGIVPDFIVPVVGAGAWMGSREARRHLTDLMTMTAHPRWARLLATWAATAIWALVGCGLCVAVMYGVTAHQASWGGPLWWPVVVAATSVVAFSAIGFAAGALLPGRLTAPLIAVGSWFVLVLGTQLITGSQSYWQILPVVSGPWDYGQDPGAAIFYPFVPDLSIAQIMFLAGLTVALLAALAVAGSGRVTRTVAASIAAAGMAAACTSVVVTGAGTLDAHGMIAIPALHDAASDRPIRFTPVCSSTAIRVCLNPAYARYLPAVAAKLAPMLVEIAGLPSAPVRISQAAATSQQGAGNAVTTGLTGPQMLGGVYRMLLPVPDQGNGPYFTTGQLAGQARDSIGPAVVASFVGDGPAASEAQHAVDAALSMDAGLPAGTESSGPPIPPGSQAHRHPAAGQSLPCTGIGCGTGTTGKMGRGSPVEGAARRFAALSLATRRAWLATHLAALRAGQITLAQLP